MVAGGILLDTILRRLGAEELTLCDLALREGLVLDYVRRNKRRIERVDTIPDVRRRSTIELAERCNYDAAHAQHIARLALALFDQTRSLHGMTDREREWLEFASLLHDIGAHISFVRHHRHSYYLIKNGDLRGFQPDEIEVIALVARYHRRGTPKSSHDEYAGLPAALRRTVRILASILRVAESLDRSHGQVISSLELRDDAGTIALADSHRRQRRRGARTVGHRPPFATLREADTQDGDAGSGARGARHQTASYGIAGSRQEGTTKIVRMDEPPIVRAVPQAAARRSVAAVLQRTVPERRPGAVGRRGLPGCQ